MVPERARRQPKAGRAGAMIYQYCIVHLLKITDLLHASSAAFIHVVDIPG
jgi:hypothetical protein